MLASLKAESGCHQYSSPRPYAYASLTDADMAYVPPHRRGIGRLPPEPRIITLDSLVTPDDSISCAAGGVEGSVFELTELSELQVAQVLHGMGLGRYAEACLRVPLRGKDLVHCREDDLESIGITFRPHRLSLLEEVERFKREGVAGLLLEGEVPDDAPAPAPPKTLSPVLAADGDDSQSSAAISETPTWLVAAKESLAELPADATHPGPAAAPASPAAAGAAGAGAGAAGASGVPSADGTSRMSRELDLLVDSLESMQTASGASASTDLLNRLVDKLEGTLGNALGGIEGNLDGLQMGMAEAGAGGSSGAGGASGARRRPSPSELDMITARLEGLALRSEAGTAVRAVQAGAAARHHSVAKNAWKWTAREGGGGGSGPS